MRWGGGRDGWFTADLRAVFMQRMPPFLYGVGTWFGPGVDDPAPLLVVDEEEITVDPFPPVSFESEPDEIAPPPELVVGKTRNVSNRAGDALRAWLDSAVIIPCSKPEPLVAVGSVLLDPSVGHRGTVGVPVVRTMDNSSIDGFLTAGHVVSGLGAQVVKSRRSLPTKGPVLGQVACYSDPVAPPGAISTTGFDIAVVDLDPGQSPLSPVSTGVAQLPSSPPQPVPVRVRCGFSRKSRLGMICASLMAGGSPRRQWQDCWILTPGLAQAGDSGSPVITTAGQELVGMLVGGARQGGRLRYAFHYVQDHDSTQQALLTPSGVVLK
jgi:hypothetical protein